MGRAASTPIVELVEPTQRDRPRSRRRSALVQEGLRLKRELALFDGLVQLAEDEDNVKGGEKLRALAWANVEQAEPIRVLYARQILGVSDRTVAEWCRRGVLEERPGSVRRATLTSILRAKQALDELRAAGRDRDLLSAVLNRLELDELRGNDRFRRSLAQAKRGERGEWPEGW